MSGQVVELRARAAEVPSALRDRRAAAIPRREGARQCGDLRVLKVAAAQPRLERELLHERRWQDAKLGREQFSVGRGNAKRNERAGVAQDGGADDLGNLLCVLVGEAEVGRELARFGEDRRECVGRERLEFVDVDEVRHASLRRYGAARHGRELDVGDEERAEDIGRLLPYRPLGEVRDHDLSVVHRVRERELRRRLPEDQPEIRRGRELAGLVEDRRGHLQAILRRVLAELVVPEAARYRIGVRCTTRRRKSASV